MTAIAALALLVSTGAHAQEVSVPSVTVANPGGYANPLKLDTDRYDREQRSKRQPTSRRPSTACSAAALPANERRAMEVEYGRRLKRDGKASADQWVAEQGRRFRMRLVAQGICPAPAGMKGATKAAAQSTQDKRKKGGKCTQTVMQPRHIANPYGGAMSMIMVPVCVN